MGNVPLAIGQAFQCAVFIVGITPTVIGKVSFGSDLSVFIKGVSIAFAFRVGHLAKVETVFVVVILPTVALTIDFFNEQVKRPVFQLPIYPIGISVANKVTVSVVME